MTEKQILFYGCDDWTDTMLVFWRDLFRKCCPGTRFYQINNNDDFNDTLSSKNIDGIVIVFNPVLNRFDNAWSVLQKNKFYRDNRILYLANTYGMERCRPYVRKNLDMLIDFCNEDLQLVTDILLQYVKTGDLLSLAQ